MIIFGKDEPVIKSQGIHFYHEEDRNVIFPKVAVGVYSRHLYHDIVSKYQCNEIGYVKNANLEKPLYIMKYKDCEVLLFMAGVSAPHIAGDIEEIAYHGVDTFIIFGNCGVLDKTIPDCGIIIPNLAYREEGVSYHYIDGDDPIELDDTYKDLFIDILIGDFDSLDLGKVNIDSRTKILKLYPVKDDTDVLDAVKYALDMGYNEFFIYGALGKRVEHSIANIGVLSYIKDHNANGFLFDQSKVIRVVKNERIILDSKYSGYISIFSM